MNDINSKIDLLGKIANAGESKTKKSTRISSDGAFDKLLAHQLSAGSPDSLEKSTASQSGLSEIQGAFRAQQLGTASFNLNGMAERVNDSLTLFDRYASFLGNPDKNLKEVYGLLERLISSTRSLAEEMNQQPKPDNGHARELKRILSQIMTTAQVEQVKFNRGDYL